MSALDPTDSKLAQALAECERLQMENRQLRERLGIPPMDTAVQIVSQSSTQVTVTAKSSPDEKVKLFRSLFRGRDDIYAIRWEGRNGKTGYSPAYPKTWSNSFQNKPDAPQEYFPLTDQVIHDHLTGKLTAEVYSVRSAQTMPNRWNLPYRNEFVFSLGTVKLALSSLISD